MTPVAIDAINGFNAAPCHGGCDGGVTAAGVDAAALTVNFRWLFRILLFEMIGIRLNGLVKVELFELDFGRSGWGKEARFGPDL